jgi:lipoprotein NlpI
LGRYQEIIDLEKNYKIYSSDRKKYMNLLSMTNFYLGIAFVNSGDISKGAFYLTLASRNAISPAQSSYYDSFIDQISAYL